MISNNDKITLTQTNDLLYVQFTNLKKYEDLLTHCFTTRLGGVSQGECQSLNLSFNRNDSRENVIRNYRILSEALKVDFDKMVLSDQVHDNKIRFVGPEDAGKGLTKASDIKGFDGLTTNIPGIPLVTFYADCVPVLLLDPVKKAITAVHSGWKSTVKNISFEAVKLMQTLYGTDPADLQAAIGPSICGECFEVDSDVYTQFINKFEWCNEFTKYQNGKYYIALQPIIQRVLKDAGLLQQNITISEVCTRCNRDVFFSYRGDCRKTGSLAAIMMLK